METYIHTVEFTYYEQTSCVCGLFRAEHFVQIYDRDKLITRHKYALYLIRCLGHRNKLLFHHYFAYLSNVYAVGIAANIKFQKFQLISTAFKQYAGIVCIVSCHKYTFRCLCIFNSLFIIHHIHKKVNREVSLLVKNNQVFAYYL